MPGVTSFRRMLISILPTYRNGVWNDPKERQDDPEGEGKVKRQRHYILLCCPHFRPIRPNLFQMQVHVSMPVKFPSAVRLQPVSTKNLRCVSKHVSYNLIQQITKFGKVGRLGAEESRDKAEVCQAQDSSTQTPVASAP